MSRFIYYKTPDDDDYLAYLKPYFRDHKVIIKTETPITRAQIVTDCMLLGAEAVFTTSARCLQLLASETNMKRATLDDFNGSIIKLTSFRDDSYTEIPALVLNPLHHVVTVPYGKFLLERFIKKITEPDNWFHQTKFHWATLSGGNIDKAYALLATAAFIAVDIETVEARWITRVSYTGFWIDPVKGFSSQSYVLEIDSGWALAWMRKFNLLEPAKVLQNGKYDSAFFFRYSAPMRNWKWDTITMFHSLYSELPKRLAFITPFFLRDVEFWKDDGKSSNREDQQRYNARDGWATGNVMLAWLQEAPDWAVQNYLMEFPVNFPCHLSEMTGIRADRTAWMQFKVKKEAEIVSMCTELDTMLGVKNFNSNSTKQVKQLLYILGNRDVESSSEIEIKKAMYKHPIAGRILNSIIKIRKARKLISTYLDEDKLWGDKILYNLNPHGTDTARLASQESHFDCGLQIQNIPSRDARYKEILIAEDGFYFCEADYEQAEARDTGYLSGDTALITSVNSPQDYHSVNAERFFGIPYPEIISTSGEVIKKDIRDLSKRVNHGANYNMGAGVLVDTMGLDKIFEAAHILKLPVFWGARQIAEYLLERYDLAYPTVRHEYYDDVVTRVITSQKLVSPLGWTRYCFGNPKKSKMILNSYVAHPSQNLNAGTLNKAYMAVFKAIALKYPNDFKLCAQIHDSILFQYRIGHEYLIPLVKQCMEIPIAVTDRLGITRELLVPVGIKAGATRWGALKTWKEPSLS